MRELNLVPYQIREKKAMELYIRNQIALGVIILCILFICVYLPKQGLNKLKNIEVNLISQIVANKNVEEESKNINKQVSNVNNYTEKIIMLTNNKIFVSKRISLLQKYIPKEVTLKTLSYNKGNLILTGASGKYNSISEFAANLQASKEFKSVELTSINNGADIRSLSPNYKFSITIIY